MDRLFWFTYLLFVGFLVTVLAACGGGGGAAGDTAQGDPLVGADGSVLFPNKCAYSAWVKT